MVVNPLPFEVTIDPNGSPTDITPKITSIDSCKFQGTGRIRTASIMLNALNGAFITNTNGGTTPQINEFDKIRIKWQDENENIKSGLFEVDTELAQKTDGGTTLPLELKGRERALQDVHTTAYFEFQTPFTVINILIITYNTNKGSAQPAVTTLFPNKNPLVGVTNIYDFSSKVSIYDAIMHVITRLNQPTSAGGVGNFYSVVFEDDAITDDLEMTIKVQGSGTTPPTIISSDLDPTHSLSYRIDVRESNQVFVRGQPNTGAVPNGFHDFTSTVEEVNNYPAYVSTGTYAIGQRVIEDGIIFEAILEVPTSTPPPNITFWATKTFADIAGSIQYSEWTNNKAVVTKNSCSNPTNNFLASAFDSPAFPDGNLVVRESFYFRDFVLIRSIDDTKISLDATNKFYLRGQVQPGLYKGFRILVDTTLGNPDGSFGNGSGTIFSDRFGRSFEDAMVQWTGSEWIVFREPKAPTVTNKEIDHCCVLAEGKIYEYNAGDATTKQVLAIRKSDVFRGGSSGGPFQWLNFFDASGENDAFHHPKNIEQVDGLLTNEIRSNQDISSFITGSALKITYEFNLTSIIQEGVQRIGNFFTTAADSIADLFNNPIEDTVAPTNDELVAYGTIPFYDIGWWYALPFPYPLSEFNGITENVGDLYGLGDGPNAINTTLFGSLDIQNTTFSSQGKFGLNHDQVDDMGGPFTALGFYFNFNILLATSPQPFKGDIPFTITIYDDLSQVWRADFQYRHMGTSDEYVIPFSSFTVNRPSRNPWSIDTLLINLIHTPELEIRSIFQERRVRLITWQLKTSYDDDERYMPYNTDNFITALFSTNGVFTFEGTIDGLRLVKQPFVSSGIETTRVLNSQTIEATNTRNKKQLIAIAVAEQQRKSHKFEAYTYVENIRCDLVTEQSVFLEDIDMVKFADRGESSPGASDGDPNTRKCVVLEENFTYNAEGKQSGALHELVLVKRLPEA